MTQRYASSVYSQKSIKSAKSTKSFLSVGHSILSFTPKSTVIWNNIKNWLPGKKKDDSDSISTSSISKLKRLFYSKSLSIHDDFTPTSFDHEFTTTDSLMETNLKRTIEPVGILVNRENDSEKSIEERKERRRRKRRENRLKHYDLIDHQTVSSSSDTLTTTPPNDPPVLSKENPRIIFVEPSPVPRFRNLPPPPPPSPPYMNILIDDDNHRRMSIIQSPVSAEDEDVPTIYTEKFSSNQETPVIPLNERRMLLLIQSLNTAEKKHRLYFKRPYHKGQVLTFSLQNTLPEDHVILFKFMTSNTNNGTERYFIRPSAGKIDSIHSTEIMLFLNQVPSEQERIKDKIMIRWAIIQRDSEIESHVHQLQESTRRKWIELLEEQWPNQFTIKMTKIKIDFL
ncbi:hypothetical protein G6F57_004028 [Rhizopus arrhizus]|uniref:MSP domain-containing protein n=1 Tax=Rhizopus oryzae TaxID=64495 RepID=A0A9P6XDF1_RHIOR|nr:hypothetical protein G6F23_003761 [Rhizopus arrhizus]KAG1427268.1 hypothetical protein G6F58_001102 [Rhizopus delemar]KAG0768532.1 hypothetical protein G6F24_001852 [Rhizopus arrhizus]KAG0795212.1 hypothetical protein G6F21_002271 [Rhizopus arrhizus]KAG0819261.1 hypothetical protein G6F20_000914 [Rhizopus arrhizus]